MDAVVQVVTTVVTLAVVFVIILMGFTMKYVKNAYDIEVNDVETDSPGFKVLSIAAATWWLMQLQTNELKLNIKNKPPRLPSEENKK